MNVQDALSDPSWTLKLQCPFSIGTRLSSSSDDGATQTEVNPHSSVAGSSPVLDPGQQSFTTWLHAPTRYNSPNANSIWLDARMAAAYTSGASVLLFAVHLLLQRAGVVSAARVPATNDQGRGPSSGVLSKLRRHFVQYGGPAVATFKVTRVLVTAAQSALAIMSAVHVHGHGAGVFWLYGALAGAAVRQNMSFHRLSELNPFARYMQNYLRCSPSSFPHGSPGSHPSTPPSFPSPSSESMSIATSGLS